MMNLMDNQKFKNILFLLNLICFPIDPLSNTSYSQSIKYYVDSFAGDDNNPGTTPQVAWKTLTKINSKIFNPGDEILFKSGGKWNGQLSLHGSGSSEKRIIIDCYENGAKPQIIGDGGVAALLLKNQDQWEINNLDILNDGQSGELRRGILVLIDNTKKTYSHIYFKNINVHNVKGKLGEDIISKATGGIGFEIRGKENSSRFDDLLIEGCSITSVDNVGIYIWSDLNIHPRDPKWTDLRCTNVVIRNNILSDMGKNAMIVRISESPIIEKNIVKNAASRFHGNAIVIFGCKDAVIQHNEVYGTKYYGLEGAAYDSDYNCEGTVIQYNYSHDNEGGMVNFCNNPESKSPRGFNNGTIVRYNISQNDIYRVFAFDGTVTNTHIYNNTIYVGEHLSPQIISFDIFGKALGYASNTRFSNNIICNLGKGNYTWGESTENVFENNCFYGNHPINEPADEKKITLDPMFSSPGNADTGIDSVIGYKLISDSPCINSGINIEKNGGRDFWGNQLYVGNADRGAFEFCTDLLPNK